MKIPQNQQVLVRDILSYCCQWHWQGSIDFNTVQYTNLLIVGDVQPNTSLLSAVYVYNTSLLGSVWIQYFVVVCMYTWVLSILIHSYFIFVFLYLSASGLGYITRKHSAEWPPPPNSHQSPANRLSPVANFQSLLLNNNQTGIGWTIFKERSHNAWLS